jgi:hypothetical protein
MNRKSIYSHPTVSILLSLQSFSDWVLESNFIDGLAPCSVRQNEEILINKMAGQEP